MKLRLTTLLCAVSVMASMISCTDENWRETNLPPTDVDAENVVLTDILASDGERSRPYYVFTVELGTEGASKSGSGIVLEAKFISNGTSLHQAQFTAAEAASAGRNNFITGETGTKLYINGEQHLVTAGTIDVTVESGNYAISGVVKLDNGSWYDLDWAGGSLSWGELPEMVKLVEVMSTQSNVASGTKSVTINLTDGKWKEEYDMTTWPSTLSGSGNYLAVDFYSEDGYLAPGRYKACATGGVINEGEFGIGWDPGDLWGIGMVFSDWGTCWWTVDANAEVQKTAKKITSGEIVVELAKDKTYTIYIDNNELITEFVGKIPEVTKPDKPSGGDGGSDDGTVYTELTTLLSATSNVSSGTLSLTINMAQEGVSSSVNEYWQTVWNGAGNYLALDIYSADGKLYTGTYNACETGGAIGEGQFGIGWDPGDLWGIGMVFENWGTCWWTVADGAATAQKVLDGTVKVSVKGDNLVIALKSSTANARFTYPVASFVDGSGNPIEVVNLGGDEDEDDTGDGVEYQHLSKFISFQSNVQSGTNSVTINVGTDGISSSVNESWQTVWEGEGNYLAMDIYSADGNLAPGTYTACATGGAIAEGEFGIGWDPGDLWGIGMVFENWGTCWWTVSGGAATAQKVVDGTLTVEVEGDIYTISLQSSLVNAQYVGKLSAE